MSEDTLAVVAAAILVVVGLSSVGLVIGRLTHRRAVRRASAIGLGVALVVLGVAAQFDRRAEDCARQGGTMVDDAPLVLESQRGRTQIDRSHCVLPVHRPGTR